MIAVGKKVPEATVWLDSRERTSIAALAARGPCLLLFYLYDWSSV